MYSEGFQSKRQWYQLQIARDKVRVSTNEKMYKQRKTQELYICHSNLKLVKGGQYLVEVVLTQMRNTKKKNKYGSVSTFPQRHNLFS